MVACENFVSKHVEWNSLKQRVVERFCLDQHFWSLEWIKVLINHILGNHYGFATSLKYHAMSKSQCKSTQTLHKKWSFPLRISLVNVIKSTGNCGFGHIHWKNP